MDLREKIAKAKQEFAEAEPVRVPVEVGGESTLIEFLPVLGSVWVGLTAVNPARPGADGDDELGYNPDGVTAAYPVDRVLVDGDVVSAEVWADLYGVLTAPARTVIANDLWREYQLRPALRLAAAGKEWKGGLVSSPDSPES